MRFRFQTPYAAVERRRVSRSQPARSVLTLERCAGLGKRFATVWSGWRSNPPRNSFRFCRAKLVEWGSVLTFDTADARRGVRQLPQFFAKFFSGRCVLSLALALFAIVALSIRIVTVRDAIEVVPDELAISGEIPSHHRPKPFAMSSHRPAGKVVFIECNKHDCLPSLLFGRKPELVHEGVLSEEINPCGIEKSRGLVLVVKRQFARNEIAVHADDEWLHFHFVFDTLLNQIHLPREFPPADWEQIHLCAVADAGQSQCEVVEKNSIRQRTNHHGRQPRRAYPSIARALTKLPKAKRKCRKRCQEDRPRPP